MEIVAANSEIRIHPTRVFVGGLARGTTELDLENFFSEYGPITDVRIVCDKRTGLNKGYGFVTYENPESRDNLLKMGLIDYQGRKLRLRQAVRRKGQGQFVEPSNGYYQWVLVPDSVVSPAPTDYRVPTVYYPASGTSPIYNQYHTQTYIPATCGYSVSTVNSEHPT